jgi:hypothetical protein
MQVRAPAGPIVARRGNLPAAAREESDTQRWRAVNLRQLVAACECNLFCERCSDCEISAGNPAQRASFE